MKTYQTLLSLTAALLAMPAMAQDGRAADKLPQDQQPLRYQINADREAFGFLVIACSPEAAPFDGRWILTNGAVQMLRRQGDKFLLDMDIPAALPADLYLQAATYGEQGLRIHEIEKYGGDVPADDPRQTNGEQELPADGRANGEADGQARQRAELEPNEQGEEQLPIDLQFTAGEEGTCDSRLHARFVAPSDDYRLDLVRVVRSDDSRSADVYLYRKLPGKGEGLRDVVEEHSQTVDLGDAQQVAVFFAEGTEQKPNKATTWKLIARFRK